MDSDTGQSGVVAKRGLPSDFHTPVPHTPGRRTTIAHCYRTHATIMRATPVAVLPSVRLYKPAGKVSAALSPDEIPFDQESLAAVRPKANSRFFTDCYHEAAAIGPPGSRKGGASPAFHGMPYGPKAECPRPPQTT